MSRRRGQRRPSAPSRPRLAISRGLPFSDVSDPSDWPGELFSTSSTASGAVPRPLSRLARLLTPPESEALPYRRGMGAAQAPMQAAWTTLAARSRSRLARLSKKVNKPGGVHLLDRAVQLARGSQAIRLMQNPKAVRSLAQLDRRSRVCISRRIRRGVLFAAAVAGKHRRLSGGMGGRYRHSLDSSFSCR